MSTKTFFKRAALIVVASLGLGILSVPSSQAAVSTTSLTLGSATATATVGDTATGTWTLRFVGDNAGATSGDSVIVKYGCDAPALATCPSILVAQSATSDSANAFVQAGRSAGTYQDISGGGRGESMTAASVATTMTAATASPVSVRSAALFKAVNFPKAGTYTYTFFLYQNLTSTQSIVSGSSSYTWTVTVTAPDTSAKSIKTSYFAETNAQAAYYRYVFNGNKSVPYAASTDSAITALAGAATTNTLAGVLYVVPANAAGDTRVAIGDGFVAVQDTLTATITGAGVISANSGTTKASSVTMNVSSYDSNTVQYAGESLVVYSNGTVGVGTITLTNSAGTTLLTKTITFTGPATSGAASLGDTYTIIGGSPALSAQVKDAGGNLLSSGTFYAFVSDTKIVSAGATLYSNAATQYQTSGRCSTWDTTTKRVSCSLTVADTGTVSVYFADSWNVTASSFVTTAISMTVTGNTIGSATVAFDKATYAPGERAVITITTKDIAGNLHANGATGTFTSVTSNYALTGVTTLPQRGTASSDATFSSALTEYQDTGVETRVVNMPSVAGGDVTYTVEIPGFGVGVATTKVTATAKVVDPTQTAQNTAIANAQAAADAATDAALQAIDAANAATDAANLAAEAADAATVAAQESKDSADAATAAVESLATQVATLMAALQAQITSLANVVAKIAKKVKA